MDQFTPGQIVVIHQAWEMYRHKSGYSELFYLAEDGYSCKKKVIVPTPKPATPKPATPTRSSKPGKNPTKSGKTKRVDQAEIDMLIEAEPTYPPAPSSKTTTSIIIDDKQEEPLVHEENN